VSLKLNKFWTSHLLKYPETYMGSQLVDIVLKSGEVIESVIVLNADELMCHGIKLNEIMNLKVKDVSNENKNGIRK